MPLPHIDAAIASLVCRKREIDRAIAVLQRTNADYDADLPSPVPPAVQVIDEQWSPPPGQPRSQASDRAQPALSGRRPRQRQSGSEGDLSRPKDIIRAAAQQLPSPFCAADVKAWIQERHPEVLAGWGRSTISSTLCHLVRIEFLKDAGKKEGRVAYQLCDKRSARERAYQEFRAGVKPPPQTEETES